MVPLTLVDRACGDCRACCTVIGVKELGKPFYEPCIALCESGCSAYSWRPNSCRIYKCPYLVGLLDERPNVTGVLIDLEEETPERFWLAVYEVRPGALSNYTYGYFDRLRPWFGPTVGVRYYRYKDRISTSFATDDATYPGYSDIVGYDRRYTVRGHHYEFDRAMKKEVEDASAKAKS